MSLVFIFLSPVFESANWTTRLHAFTIAPGILDTLEANTGTENQNSTSLLNFVLSLIGLSVANYMVEFDDLLGQNTPEINLTVTVLPQIQLHRYFQLNESEKDYFRAYRYR